MTEKVFFEIEVPIHASPELLYQYISTSSGLSEWFADNVTSRGEIFNFAWDAEEQSAKLISKKTNERVKFRWLDENMKDTNYHFEIKIMVDELTKDVSIYVSDFVNPEDFEDSNMLWENQINELKHVIGAV
jgi:uncharacterized protein YndB with AHSA1/START domain